MLCQAQVLHTLKRGELHRWLPLGRSIASFCSANSRGNNAATQTGGCRCRHWNSVVVHRP